MQIEADAEPNFLIIMLNNVQDPNASNPSQSAEKYLTNGEGAIKEAFLSRGLQLDESYYLLANNKNFSIDKEGAKNEDKSIKASPTQIQNKTPSLKIKKAKQPHNAKSTPNFKPWKVATPGTFIDTSEDLSDHDEGNKAFDKDVEEGDDDEAEARNMNDGFIANSSYEQELTEKESTTLGDETLDTLYFDASLWMRSYDNKWNMFNIFLCASDLGGEIRDQNINDFENVISVSAHFFEVMIW